MEPEIQTDFKVICMPEHTNLLLVDMHLLQLEGALCDVKLQTNTSEILAHRLVLIAASPYFRDSLICTKAEDGMVTLFIEDTEHKIMDYMVNFLYSGSIQIPANDVEPFARLCDQLMLPKLSELCLHKIKDKEDKETASNDISCKVETREKDEINKHKTMARNCRKRKTNYIEESDIHNSEVSDQKKAVKESDKIKSIKIVNVKTKAGRKPRVVKDSKVKLVNYGTNRKDSAKTVKKISRNNKTNCKTNIGKTKGLNVSKEPKGSNWKVKASKENSDESNTENDNAEDTDDYDHSDDNKTLKEVQLKTVKAAARTKLKSRFPKECTVCNEMLKTCKEYSVHMKTHRRAGVKATRRVRKWPCSVCGRVLTSAVRQACHQNSKHGVPFDPQFKLHVCTYEGCNYTTASKHYLQIHSRGRHSNERPHVCEFCGKGFKLPSALITHLNIHTNAKIYQCEECDLTFNQKGGLDIHIKKHHKGQESWSELCHLCSEKFLHKAELCWHLYQVHQLPVPDRYTVFSCELCDYQTIRKNKLDRHMDAHDNKRTFVCNVCGKKFVTKSYLNRHSKYHGEKSFKCDFEGCNYACVDKLGLRKHVMLMHTHKNYKPFLCSICPYKTGLRGNLDKHIRTVHNLEVVTKHTVQLKMKFKGRTSGDIINKDGKLVQRVMDTRHSSSSLHGAEEEEEVARNLVIHEEFEQEATDLVKRSKKTPPKPESSPPEDLNQQRRPRTSENCVIENPTSSNQLPLRDFPPNYMLNPNPYPMVSQIQMPTAVPGDTRAPMPGQAQQHPDMYLTIDPMQFKYSEYY